MPDKLELQIVNNKRYRLVKNDYYVSMWTSEIDRISFSFTPIGHVSKINTEIYDVSDCKNHLDILKKHPHIFL